MGLLVASIGLLTLYSMRSSYVPLSLRSTLLVFTTVLVVAIPAALGEAGPFSASGRWRHLAQWSFRRLPARALSRVSVAEMFAAEGSPSGEHGTPQGGCNLS